MAVLDYQWVAALVLPLVEYLMLDFLYSGTTAFWLLDSLYTWCFDIIFRQRPSKSRDATGAEAPDWENPTVCGKGRRFMHAPLRAFSSREIALKYWITDDASKRFAWASRNVMHLTRDVARTSEAATDWEFCLVGSPAVTKEVSLSEWSKPWYKVDDVSDYEWRTVTLPCHWQLSHDSPRDVPIYTNTSYPFRFDPPFVSRDGHWKVTDCDAGLGGNVATHIDELNPAEPGPNPTGLYRKWMVLPEAWNIATARASHRFSLHFEGVDAAFYVYVNGRRVGYAQDSRLPSEFDITEALDFTSNARQLVAVQVMRWCDGSYIEDQDMWWLSGIYREVTVMRKPVVSICDYEVTPEVSFAPCPQRESGFVIDSAHIHVSVELENYSKGCKDPSASPQTAQNPLVSPQSAHFVRWECWAPGGQSLVKSGVLTAVPGEIQARAAAFRHAGLCASAGEYDSTVRNILVASTIVTLDANTVQLWSADAPALYVMIFSLHATMEDADCGAHPIDVESVRVGVRSVRIDRPVGGKNEASEAHASSKMDPEAGRLLVNNVPITVRGVNRHEFDPSHGRVVDENLMLQDIGILKRLNFNAVRCSHYPNHPRWYELCDEHGLYLVDEANIESHGFQILGQATGYLSGRPEWGPAHLSRISRMYERDKNASCILIWSLGNESGVGTAHERAYRWLDMRDPSRQGGWQHGGGESIPTLCGLGPLYRMLRHIWRSWIAPVGAIRGPGRPIQYESGGAISHVTDILCPMYLRPQWCRDKVAYESSYINDPLKRPVILCEYAHAMGNSGGGLADYWELFWAQEGNQARVQGGFIWEYIDQGLEIRPHHSLDEVSALDTRLIFPKRFGYGGNFGDIPNTSCFCITGILGPDRSPHPLALEAWAQQQPVAFTLSSDAMCLSVTNRYDHICLRDVVDINARFLVYTTTATTCTCPSDMSTAEVVPLLLPLSCAALFPGERCDIAFSTLVEQIPTGQLKRIKALFGERSSIYIALDISAVAKGVPSKPKRRKESYKKHDRDVVFDMDSDLYTIARTSFDVTSVAVSDLWPKNSLKISDVGNNEDTPLRLSAKEDGEGGFIVSCGTAASPKTMQVGACGRLISVSVSGVHANDGVTELIKKPLDLCLARAPTNNDVGGMGLSYAARWSSVGLGRQDGLVRWGCPTVCLVDENTNHADNDCIRLKATWKLVPESHARKVCLTDDKKFALSPGADSAAQRVFTPSTTRTAAMHYADDPRPARDVSRAVVSVCMEYTFNAAGVHISYEVDVPSTLPPLPRVGLALGVPSGLKATEGCDILEGRVKWLGQGPHEAYPDRRDMNGFGLYSTDVTTLAKDALAYIVPQECGARGDTQMLSLSTIGSHGCGKMVVTPLDGDHDDDHGDGDDGGGARVSSFSWSVLPVSLNTLASATHRHQLMYVDSDNCEDKHKERKADRADDMSDSDGNDDDDADSATNLLDTSDHQALRHDNSTANASKHHCGTLYVHVDSRMMGLGGYDSWSPNVPSKFLLPSGRTYRGGASFSFTLMAHK